MWIAYNNPEASDMYKRKVSSKYKKRLETRQGLCDDCYEKVKLESVTNASD